MGDSSASPTSFGTNHCNVPDSNDIPRPTFALNPDKFNSKFKVGSNCKLDTVLKYIKECLRDHPNGMEWFKNSQFAPLFDIASDMHMVLTPLSMLLTRIVESPDKSEIWFVLNGVPIRYSLMEHALMSGLNCSQYPPEPKDVEDGNFSHKYLMPKATVKLLREQLIRVDILPSDKLKLALLYLLVSVFFIPAKENSPIDPRLIPIVDDLEFAKTYPWGRLSYSALIEQLKTLELKSKLLAANPQLNFRFFVIPLMLFPFECIPRLSPFGRLRENIPSRLPRMCKWTTKLAQKKKYPTLAEILMLVGSGQDIKSLLQPTPEEHATEYMQRFAPFDETNGTASDNTTKQWTEILEKGGKIVFDDIFKIDVESRRSIIEKDSIPSMPMNDNVPVVNKQPHELMEKCEVAFRKLETVCEKLDMVTRRVEWVENILRDILRKSKSHEDGGVGEDEGLGDHEAEVEAVHIDRNTAGQSPMQIITHFGQLLPIVGDDVTDGCGDSKRMRTRSKYIKSPFVDLNEERKNRKVSSKANRNDPVVARFFNRLTQADKTAVSSAMQKSNQREQLVTHVSSGYHITVEGLQCLSARGWLNDEVINFYFALLKDREIREPTNFLQCHYFSTFFYPVLVGGGGIYNYESVTSWTTSIPYQLVNCHKIFVPIHKTQHWCLGIINVRDKKLEYLDSLGGSPDDGFFDNLARYFVDEVKHKSGISIDLSSWQLEINSNIPKQSNNYDCGMFMIKYADFLSSSADIGLCFEQSDMLYFRQRVAKEILRMKVD